MSQILVQLRDVMGNDLSICETAWTSSYELGKNSTPTNERIKGLITMLADSGHGTPFESVVFKFWIKMPIQTDRQHMTHRIASHNGMSGRYRTMPNEWLELPEEVNSILELAFGTQADSMINEYDRLCADANNWYSKVSSYLKSRQGKEITNEQYKRAREVIRGVLPQNNMTERVTVINLRSFANYQRLRNNSHAQPEIREVARLMLEEVKKAAICPLAIEALEKNSWKI